MQVVLQLAPVAPCGMFGLCQLEPKNGGGWMMIRILFSIGWILGSTWIFQGVRRIRDFASDWKRRGKILRSTNSCNASTTASSCKLNKNQRNSIKWKWLMKTPQEQPEHSVQCHLLGNTSFNSWYILSFAATSGPLRALLVLPVCFDAPESQKQLVTWGTTTSPKFAHRPELVAPFSSNFNSQNGWICYFVEDGLRYCHRMSFRVMYLSWSWACELVSFTNRESCFAAWVPLQLGSPVSNWIGFNSCSHKPS